MKSKVSVIIPAAGSGQRMKADRPKQFIEINGKTILSYTISVFEKHPDIDEIIIVGPKEHLAKIKDISKIFSKVVHVVEGGKERQDSVKNGFKHLSKNCDYVLVHDAVRPFVSNDIIDRVLNALETNQCVITGIAVSSTIKKTNDENYVVSTINRDNLREIQTPQAMHRNVFKASYDKAEKMNFYGTDEAMIAEFNSVEVFVVEGNKKNFKVTTYEDIDYCHFLAKNMQQMK